MGPFAGFHFTVIYHGWFWCWFWLTQCLYIYGWSRSMCNKNENNEESIRSIEYGVHAPSTRLEKSQPFRNIKSTRPRRTTQKLEESHGQMERKRGQPTRLAHANRRMRIPQLSERFPDTKPTSSGYYAEAN